MSLTKDSQKKQVVGIVLVVVALLVIFVFGTRSYRASKGYCYGPKKVSTQAETCQADNGLCPVETPLVR